MESRADQLTGISEAFASVLRSGREQFNAQFTEARHLYRELDGQEFLQFLQQRVDPLVRSIATTHPDRVAEVTMAAYDASLELVGQRLVGPAARFPVIEEGWRRIFAAVPALLAEAPALLIASVSNALHHLATTPGARSAQWISQMEKLGAGCANSCEFLSLGQVAAWQAGLAHFRAPAIGATDSLPPELALAGVGAPASANWTEIRDRLLGDPWFDPTFQAQAGKTASRELRVVARAGVFRGFGGVLTQPPLVVSIDGDFLLSSGAECWLMTADLFGSTFHRAGIAEFKSALAQSQTPKAKASGSKVVWGNESCDLASLGQITSLASNDTTVAVTAASTHAVILLARQPS